MNKSESVTDNQVSVLQLLLRVIYFIFIAGFFFSTRAISSISTGFLFAAGLLLIGKKNHDFPVRKAVLLFVTSCAAIFFLNFFHLLFTGEGANAWSNILLTSGILILPIALTLSRSFISQNTTFFLTSFYTLLFAACSYCLALAVIRFFNTGETTVFYYHSLLKPLHYHAVYFSIIIFIVLVCLVENYPINIFQGKYQIRIALVLFFTLFLILLSSKLVISFYLGFVVLVLFRNLVNQKSYKKLFLVLTILLISLSGIFFSASVKDRFRDITSGSLTILSQDTFNRGVYFSGLQFRLLQWKFVPEILQKKDKWVSGVGADQSQLILNNEYARRKMYTGDPTRDDTGLLNYNTHNQFLQSLLENGIPGAIIFLCIIVSLVWMASQKKIFAYTSILLLITLYSFAESVFKTQYGILLFTFFPLVFYYFPKKKN